MNLCKYKNAFGIVGKGIHSYRILDIAILDVFVTLFAAFLISYFFKISFLYTSIFLFILGIIVHRLFCVRTTVDKILFPDDKK
jgi:hypothetical protein